MELLNNLEMDTLEDVSTTMQPYHEAIDMVDEFSYDEGYLFDEMAVSLPVNINKVNESSLGILANHDSFIGLFQVRPLRLRNKDIETALIMFAQVWFERNGFLTQNQGLVFEEL